jgi:hypothetical protein
MLSIYHVCPRVPKTGSMFAATAGKHIPVPCQLLCLIFYPYFLGIETKFFWTAQNIKNRK